MDLYGPDPIRWTSFERRIRCPQWQTRKQSERDGASPRTTRPGPSDWSSMKPNGRGGRARPGLNGVVAPELGRARARRSDQGQDGPHERGARGARATPERIANRPGRARNIEKSGGLLREAEPMRFTFIAAKRAEHTVTILCRCLGPAAGGTLERFAER